MYPKTLINHTKCEISLKQYTLYKVPNTFYIICNKATLTYKAHEHNEKQQTDKPERRSFKHDWCI